MRWHLVLGYLPGYTRLMKQVELMNHPLKEEIAKRVKVMVFYDNYGQAATKEAFGVCRSTVFVWKRKLRQSGGRLQALASLSRSPKRKRQPQTHQLAVEFIKQYRTKHPGVSKETIKPPLDEYCRNLGIASVCESTIGRVIAQLKRQGRIPTTRKLSFYARTGVFRDARSVPRYQKLRRKDYQPDKPGDLVQIDAITLFVSGVRRYLITAIDLPSRFGFAYSYKTLSSWTATDFLKKFQAVAPFRIARIQTDNGAEFARYFRDYVTQQGIIHYHNYPRSPRMNAYVENFNGLIQRQYVSWHLDELMTPTSFNVGLVEWLLWYNSEKPHSALGKLPPLRYFVNTFINPQKSNMLWTGAWA